MQTAMTARPPPKDSTPIRPPTQIPLRNSQQLSQRAWKTLKTLHSQFGQIHDINSARNTYAPVDATVTIEIQPDNVVQLSFKLRIIRQFEGLCAMSLKIVRSPDAMYDRSVDSEMLRQSSHAPVSRGSRFLLSCRFQNSCHHCEVHPARSPSDALSQIGSAIDKRIAGPSPARPRTKANQNQPKCEFRLQKCGHHTLAIMP